MMPIDSQQQFQAAMARHVAGDIAAAAAAYESILALDPANINVLYHLAVAEHQLLRHSRALAVFDRTTRLAPDFAEAWQGLANVRLEIGDRIGAETAYRQALRLNPALRVARERLLELLTVAAQLAVADLHLAADDQKLWRRLAECLSNIAARAGVDACRRVVGGQFSFLVDRALAAGVSLSGSTVQTVLRICLTEDLTASAASLSASLAVLARPAYRDAVMHPPLEERLSQLRRATLNWLSGPVGELSVDGLVSLAIRHFQSEYVAYCSDDETVAVAKLAGQVDEALRAGRVETMPLTVLACYRPLIALPSAESLLQLPLPESLRRLIQQQVIEPLTERKIAAGIPRLTAIAGQTSSAVREMYEANPYPRWHHLPETASWSGSFAAYLKAILPGLDAPQALYRDDFPVLIAGCGTGSQPLSLARLLPKARLTALDLSRSSLAFAQRKANEMDCRSIRFAQADILELGKLDERFPYIECTGVLHHLADPPAGLRVLAGLLQPGGIIRLGLYSTRAREHFGILAAQQMVVQGGYAAQSEDIRRFRRDLMARRHEPQIARLLQSGDFYSLSACRDLLFHVMEHCFTPLELGAFCAAAGLQFVGFEEPVPGVFAEYSTRFPGDPARLDLANWDQFEANDPGLFVCMYLFYARRPVL